MIRLKTEDLANYIRDSLVAVNNGLFAARVKGVQVEMPEFIDFNLEVIHTLNGITRTNTTNSPQKTSTENVGDRKEVTVTHEEDQLPSVITGDAGVAIGGDTVITETRTYS